MEKIIKLLNEAIKNGLDFQGIDILKIEYYSETDIRAYYDKTVRAYYNITVEDIIGKRAGFIKRLVDNNKIDNSKFYDKNILKGFMTLTKAEKTDSIIMNLSIQDKPIEFLVSILR